MLQNYFRLFLRNLRQHPAYATINIIGLALSMSVCLLIIVVIQDQWSYDQFHEHKSRIYRVTTRPNGNANERGSTPGYLGAEIAREVPGIEQTVRLGKIGTSVLYDGKSIDVVGLFADEAFFEVFSFELLEGSPVHVLDQPFQVVLSEETARKIFGDTNPIGEVVTLQNEGDFTVAGVAATSGKQSQLRFDVLASFKSIELIENRRNTFEDKNNFWSYATYLLLADKTSPGTIQEQLDGLSERNEDGFRYALQPLTDTSIGLVSSGQISAYPTIPPFIILFFCLLGVVVLLAACFNYVGLTVARSLLRAKEVGIRKTVGAARGQVILQFLAESVFVALLALVLACALLPWLISGFNNISFVGQEFGIHISPGVVYDPKLIGLFVLFSVVVGLLAGLYPALLLSRFHPVRVLKGVIRVPGTRRFTLRKTLIVLQFTFSFILIITTVLIYRQFVTMMRFDYGFDTENLVSLELQGNDYPVLRDELLRDASVQDVTAASGLPGLGGVQYTVITQPGREDTLRSCLLSFDAGVFETLGLKMLTSGNWKTAFSGSQGVILNGTGAHALGIEFPDAAIGQSVWIEKLHEAKPVIGVVSDFFFLGPDQGVEPLVVVHDPSQFRRLVMRVQPLEVTHALAHLETVWKNIDPVHPAEYGFYRTQVSENETNQVFDNLLQIIGFISTIVLIVACMGMMGLAAYGVQTRAKEIGVRKVMGANLPIVVWLLSKEFLALLIVAVLVATPVAWLVNNIWLQEFANRTNVGVFVIAISILIALLPVLIIIGTQTVRAALANPVEALRYE